MRLRYETELSSGLRPFFAAGVHYVGSSISSVFNNVDIRYGGSTAVTYNGVLVRPGDVVAPLGGSQDQASYTTFNLSFGASKDEWGIEAFVENLTNAKPELFKSGNDGELRITTSRPFTAGLRFSFKM
jgi:hypothetical protein